MSQQSFYDQLIASGVSGDIAHRASIDLAAGCGAEDSEDVAAAYEYLNSGEAEA